MRIDRETREPAPESFTGKFLAYLQERLPGLAALILSDYAKGALTPPFLMAAIRLAKAHGVPVVVDPKGSDYAPYAGATVITPNLREAGAGRGAVPGQPRGAAGGGPGVAPAPGARGPPGDLRARPA